jgi:hypothetical protein
VYCEHENYSLAGRALEWAVGEAARLGAREGMRLKWTKPREASLPLDAEFMS